MTTDDLYVDVYAAFARCQVRYLIVGGFAVNYHGVERTTAGLDVWLDVDSHNLRQFFKAVASLGYISSPSSYLHIAHGDGIAIVDGYQNIQVVPFLQTDIRFGDAWLNRRELELYGSSVYYISFEDLLAEKIKRNSMQDRMDVAALLQVQRTTRRA